MRRMTYQQVNRQGRVDALLAKSVANLTDVEKEEIREFYRGDGDWTSAFFTPPVVADFVVGLALATLPVLPRRAIDPWCGIGPFFPFLPPGTDIVGIELLQQEADLARVLNPAATIARGNTWLEWRRHVGEYDLVVANPPFGPIKQDYAMELGLGARHPLAESLALEVGVKLLRPGGVMSIIVSHGVLANKSCLYVRDWIMEQCYLHASISLPPTTFYWQGTGVRTGVLVLRKKVNPSSGRGQDYRILMAVCEDIGWDSRGRPTGNCELPAILDIYRQGFPDFGQPALARPRETRLPNEPLVQLPLLDWQV